MLEIIKCGCNYSIPRSSVVKIDTTYDGVLVTLRDNTEIRFTMSVSPQIKAIMPIVQTTTADIVTLNLDAAINGRYDRVITLTTKPQIPVQMVHVEQKIVPPEKTEDKEYKTESKKKGGRPKGSKTKNKKS